MCIYTNELRIKDDTYNLQKIVRLNIIFKYMECVKKCTNYE